MWRIKAVKNLFRTGEYMKKKKKSELSKEHTKLNNNSYTKND